MDTHTQPETARLTADVVAFAPITTGALIGAHVLLIRRGTPPYVNHWALPGGHVDVGETAHSAALRELAEETGIDLVADCEASGTYPPTLLQVGVYAEPGRDPRGRYVTFAYLAEFAWSPVAVAAADATDAQWLPVASVLGGIVPLAFGHARIIADAHAMTGRW